MLSLIFGTAHPQEVALTFLNSDTFDHEVANKSALQELVGLLQNAFEVELPEHASVKTLRLAPGQLRVYYQPAQRR